VSIRKQFVNPSWNVEEDFLKFYYQLPLEIDWTDMLVLESRMNGNEEGEEMLLTQRPPLPNQFVFMIQQDTIEQFQAVYKAIIAFLRDGVRVKDLESDILRNIMAFGKEKAFFYEDKQYVLDWCKAILYT